MRKPSPPVNHSKRKKFQAVYCPECQTLCDADEETMFCQCTTVAAADVSFMIRVRKWNSAQVNILLSAPDPKLPHLKKAKKGAIQNVQEQHE